MTPDEEWDDEEWEDDYDGAPLLDKLGWLLSLKVIGVLLVVGVLLVAALVLTGRPCAAPGHLYPQVRLGHSPPSARASCRSSPACPSRQTSS